MSPGTRQWRKKVTLSPFARSRRTHGVVRSGQSRSRRWEVAESASSRNHFPAVSRPWLAVVRSWPAPVAPPSPFPVGGISSCRVLSKMQKPTGCEPVGFCFVRAARARRSAYFTKNPFRSVPVSANRSSRVSSTEWNLKPVTVFVPESDPVAVAKRNSPAKSFARELSVRSGRRCLTCPTDLQVISMLTLDGS